MEYKLLKNKMKNKKIFITVLIIIVLIIILQLRVYFIRYKQMPQVKIVVPVKGEIANKIIVEGNIEAQDIISIEAPIYGKIQIPQKIKIGSTIKKGETILSLIPDEENIKSITEELKEAENNFNLLQKRFKILKQTCESEENKKIQEINLERAQRKYELSKNLYELGVISYQELETEEISLMQTKNNAIRAKEETQIELELANMNLLKQEKMIEKLKQQLQPVIIKGLFDGVITDINVKNNKTVSRGNELATIANLNELNVVFKISGDNISKVKKKQKVLIKTEYYATDIILGEIEEVGMFSESNERNCFKVKVKLYEKDKMIIGINKIIYGEIILEEKNGVIILPLDVIHYEENEDVYVFLYKNGIAKKQKIEIGLKDETNVEVSAGITLQDKIISQSDRELKNNEKVKIAKAEF